MVSIGSPRQVPAGKPATTENLQNIAPGGVVEVSRDV